MAVAQSVEHTYTVLTSLNKDFIIIINSSSSSIGVQFLNNIFVSYHSCILPDVSTARQPSLYYYHYYYYVISIECNMIVYPRPK